MTLPVTSGLVGRYDAQALTLSDNDAVMSWPDTSGAGNNLAGAAPVYKTDVLHGNPAVRFDGVDDELRTDLAAPIVGDRTVFTVVLNPSNDGSIRMWVSGSNNDSALLMGKWSTDDQWLFGGNSGANTFVAPIDATLVGQHSVWAMTINGTTDVVTVRADGTEIDSDSAVSIGQTLNDFGIGTQLDRSGRYYVGDVFEVLLYDRVLTAGEITDVEGYLDTKWFDTAVGPVGPFLRTTGGYLRTPNGILRPA